MKTLEDIRTRALLEVQHAHTRYLTTGNSEMYLYYRETTAERDGGIIALQDGQPGYYPITGKRISIAMTAQGYVNSITYLLRRLPVLSII